jgi:hypothetical protein
MPEVENDEQSQLRKGVLEESLTRLGWRLGTTLQIDYRWAGGDFERARSFAAALVALRPDAMLAVATISLRAVHQATDRIPVVFVGVTEPAAQGLNSVIDERCGLIEPLGSLRYYGFIGQHEQKTASHGYFGVGAAILADDDQSCSVISHR